MSTNIYPEAWAVEAGYDEFVANATDELAAITDEVLANLNPDVIRNSLQHPNGFLVHTLVTNPEGAYRLHIWPTGREDDLTPHSHPWHMVSTVLAGVYREYIPEVWLDETSDKRLIVSAFNEQRVQIGLIPSARTVSFDLGKLAAYEAGEQHILPAGAFHATPLPTIDPIVTLVRTGPQLYDNPSFVERTVNRDVQMTVASERIPPTEEQVQATWRQLAPMLEAL